MTSAIITVEQLPRSCGGCTLCCKLVPVHEGFDIDGTPAAGGFHKDAGVRCVHQRFNKGCAVYRTSKMPRCCIAWNCRWLTGDDTADLPRPDRAHYVLDIVPDFVRVKNNKSGEISNIEVVQVWLDPKHPDAWRTPALLAYLDRRGKDGIAALIRSNSTDAFTLFPPSMAGDGQWHEVHDGTVEPEHTHAEVVAALEHQHAD